MISWTAHPHWSTGSKCLLTKLRLSCFPSSKPLNLGPPSAWASIQRTDWAQHKLFSDLQSDRATLSFKFPTFGSFQPCSCLSIKIRPKASKKTLYLPDPWDPCRFSLLQLSSLLSYHKSPSTTLANFFWKTSLPAKSRFVFCLSMSLCILY